MRGWTAALIGVVLISMFVPWTAVEAGHPRETRAALSQDYRSRGFHVGWDVGRELPRKLVNISFGETYEGRASGSSETVAEAFLRAHAVTLFGTEAISVAPRGDGGSLPELSTVLDRQSLSGTQVVKRQLHRGVPVYGAEVRVNMNHDGVVMSVLSSFVPDLDGIDVRPTLSGAEALEAALGTIDRPGQTRLTPTAELVIHVDDGTPRLAYRTMIALWSPYGSYESMVDASTGEVLFTRDRIVCRKHGGERVDLSPRPPASEPPATAMAQSSAFTGRGWVLPANPLNGHPERYDLREGDDVDIYREMKDILRLDGSGYLRGDYVDVANGNTGRADEPDLVFEYSTTEPNSAFHEVNAYWHVDRFQNYMQSVLNIQNVLNRRQDVTVHGTPLDNSSFDPFSKMIDLGEGGVNDAEDGEVLIHEYGHAIHDAITVIGPIDSESAWVSEGLGDYLGATFGGNALVAEWDATSYNPGPPPNLRRTDGTKHYPEDLDLIPDPYWDVWGNGEIISSAFWNLREMIGPELADQLVIESFFLVGADLTMPDVADATVQVDMSLYGGAHMAPILTAYGDRGILDAFRLQIDHTPLDDTDVVGPYPIQVAIDHSAAITQPGAVKLHWKRLNDADFQAVTLTAAGGDQWTGELPFADNHAAIRYYITATDNNDVTAYYPTLAPDQLVRFVVDTGVPVLAAGLRAVNVEEGIRVSWKLHAKDGVAELRVLRAANGSAYAPVPGGIGLEPRVGAMSYLDSGLGLDPGDEVIYRLEAQTTSGEAAVLAGEAAVRYAPSLPGRYALDQNVPNPFNPTTRISFAIPREGPTTLRIYDLGGRLISELVNEVLPAATYQVDWDGTDARGGRVSTGTYFYRLRSGTYLETRKMILMK